MKPDLRDIVPADLRDPARAAELHRQAVARGLVAASESGRAKFDAAVALALRVGREPCRLLAAILRRGLWSVLTQGDEDAARRRAIKLQTPSKAPCHPKPMPPPQIQLSRKPEVRSPYGAEFRPAGMSSLSDVLSRMNFAANP